MYNNYILVFIGGILAAMLVYFELTGRIQYFIDRMLKKPEYKSPDVARAAKPLIRKWMQFDRSTRISIAIYSLIILLGFFMTPIINISYFGLPSNISWVSQSV